MEVQGERKDEDRGPSYEGGYLYSDICRTWDRTGHIAAFHVFTKKTEGRCRANDAVYGRRIHFVGNDGQPVSRCTGHCTVVSSYSGSMTVVFWASSTCE